MREEFVGEGRGGVCLWGKSEKCNKNLPIKIKKIVDKQLEIWYNIDRRKIENLFEFEESEGLPWQS